MKTLEEYIKKRKEDDCLDLNDVSKKDENLQICINYVFEFFNTYVNVTEQQQQLIEINEKLLKYRNQLSDYSPDTQTWLLRMYEKYGKRMHTQINKELNECSTFLLVNTEAEFRKRSYQCYSALIKSYKFMESYTEELYDYIKDQHRIWSDNYQLNLERDGIYMNPKINEYIESTCKKYKVNLLCWAENYANYYYASENLWPIHCVEKEIYHSFYNVTKAKTNKFNIDYIYSQVSILPYIKGKKTILEALVMYYWNSEIDHIDEAFYKAYMIKVCGES